MTSNSVKGKHSKNKSQIKYMKIRRDELDFIDKDSALLGSGHFGDVSRAKWNGALVAVKQFQSADARCGFWDELFYLVRLKHEHIVKLYGAYPDKKKPYIVMEYAHNSLAKVLHGVNLQYEYKIDHVVFWSLQLAKALEYIHLCNLIHRDVKSSNVLLFGLGHELKLCDFGTATKIEHTLTNGVGTVRYMAPEVIRGNHYSKKVDIFSFAVVLWEMLSRKIPLLQADGEGEENHYSVLYAIAKGARPPKIQGIPKLFSTMIERCWNDIPDERPSIEELVRKFSNLSKHCNSSEPLLRRNVYGKHVSYDPAKVKHLSSLTSHSQPFASLSSKLPTQVNKPPTQVENPNFCKPLPIEKDAAVVDATPTDTAGDMVVVGDDNNTTAPPATDTTKQQPSPRQPEPTLADPAIVAGSNGNSSRDNDVIVPLGAGGVNNNSNHTWQTNMAAPLGEEEQITQQKKMAAATAAIGASAATVTNLMGPRPPPTALPTPVHHSNSANNMQSATPPATYPIPRQYSTPMFNVGGALQPGGGLQSGDALQQGGALQQQQQSSNATPFVATPDYVATPSSATHGMPSPKMYSQFSDSSIAFEYNQQMSIVEQVSVEDEDIIRRQEQRFKRLEEQNKTKPNPIKTMQTYSDPYKLVTEKAQTRQKRASFNHPKAQPGSKYHVADLETDFQPIIPVEGHVESEAMHQCYIEKAGRLVAGRQEFTEVQLKLQSLDEQVEQYERYNALTDKSNHLMQEHARLQQEIARLKSNRTDNTHT